MKIIIILLFQIPSFFTFANGVEKIQNKIGSAKLMEDFSSQVQFNLSEKVLLSDWKKWMKNNNSSIYDPENAVAITTKVDWLYGAEHTFLTKVAFIKEENLSAYREYHNRIQQEANERENRAATFLIGNILKLGKNAYEGIKSSIEHSGTTRVSDQNNRDYDIQKSKNAEVYITQDKQATNGYSSISVLQGGILSDYVNTSTYSFVITNKYGTQIHKNTNPNSYDALATIEDHNFPVIVNIQYQAKNESEYKSVKITFNKIGVYQIRIK